jgi:hypothetical protein
MRFGSPEGRLEVLVGAGGAFGKQRLDKALNTFISASCLVHLLIMEGGV